MGWDRAWKAFKLLLSLVLVGAPLSLFIAVPRVVAEPLFIGISALLLFFAALPWVDFSTPSRSLGLVGMVLSIGMSLVSARTAFGYIQFPQECIGRGRAVCEFENLLFRFGGVSLAAAPLAILAIVIFGISARAIHRGSGGG